MLRLTVCFLIASFLFLVNITLGPRRVDSFANLTRLTHTPEQAVNLNPTLSDDGKIAVFESSADLAETGGNLSFHAIRTQISEVSNFIEIGPTRAVSPALSSDGKIVAFASTEDLVRKNADRNSEIFLFDGAKLQQLTQTESASLTSRLTDGNFQPSITANGSTIVFSSNRDLTGQNADFSREIFLFDTVEQQFTQLTNGTAVNPKISADGSRVYYIKVTADNTDLVLIERSTLIAQVIAANVPNLSLTEGRAISNDGMRLVYSAMTAPNQTQLFLFDGRDNSIRQLTQLGSRSVDVNLQPTISGDGRRIAFATRRRVTNASDGGVELYLLDLPTGEIQQITNAPAAATAEVVASLNFDGSLVAFNFPRILSDTVSDDDFRNNSEIYVATVARRPTGVASVHNDAAQGNESQPSLIAPGSIAIIRGKGLASATAETTVTVNGRQATRIYYAATDEVVLVVPGELSAGPAEFLVTNGEGLSSKAEAIIFGAAPGVFTVAGDGRGDAIVLDSDTLSTGPFDPSNGQLRLSIFATGVAQANNVSVTICGKSSVVETVARAKLIGLDEIHVLVPAELRGAGRCALVVTADGVQSNSVSVTIGGITPTPTPTPIATPTPTATPTPAPSPTPSPSPSPSPSASSGVVISQIFGGGGNAGAPLRNDFIEIFNASNVSVSLSGWSVQYASATASTWSVTPLTVTLLPGQYYLIQESSGGSNGVALPTADATGTIAMAAGSGKAALVKSSTALSGACPNDPNIIDLVGYGSTANCFRGSAPAAAPNNTNAIVRAANGCTDNRNNVADFALGPPNPRNISFLPRICTN